MNFNKKFWTMTLSAAMAASLLAGCGTSGSSADASASGSQGSNPGGEDGVFTIAYAPNESTTESADARNGLAKDLGEFLGCEVEEIQASDYNAIIEALRTGSADMAYMGSQALALGVERTDLEPIVMKAEDGDPDKAIYHSVFITNSANDAINSIEDIKGRTMAFRGSRLHLRQPGAHRGDHQGVPGRQPELRHAPHQRRLL